MTADKNPSELPVSRIDRILSYMAIGLLILSVICFFAIMIATWNGVTNFSQMPWPIVSTVTMLAPPISFILILAVLIISIIRRVRANRKN